MRESIRCPKCDGQSILHASTIEDKSTHAKDAVLSIQGDSPVTIFGSWGHVGIIEAYICEACGFTELYTRAPDEIPLGETVRRLERKPRKGYR